MVLGRRFHLLELHEQTWFPARIRDMVTDCLSGIWTMEVRELPLSPIAILLAPARYEMV